MTELKQTCKLCGHCCSYEIPVTFLDLQELAETFGMKSEQALHAFIEPTLSKLSGVMMLRKNSEGKCIFLKKNNQCMIQQEKPRVCRLFDCSKAKLKDVVPWTSYCTKDSDRALLWEQSIAVAVTKNVLELTGLKWDEQEFTKALKTIKQYSCNDGQCNVKLSRTENGEPIAMVYNCIHCPKRGTQACETPVTIDDISKMLRHLHICGEQFFKKRVETMLSKGTGGFRLKRQSHCTFFNNFTGCTIEAVKPMHCRFVPCPMRTNNSELMDRLYLGSGTLEEQFRHQLALDCTRQYVEEVGYQYDRLKFDHYLKLLEENVKDQRLLRLFCEKIAPYRYVDDTLLVEMHS